MARHAGWRRSCASLRIKQPDEIKEVTGPPKSVSYDASGKPTKAAESFARKMNLPVEGLTIVSTPKGEYLSAKQVLLGRRASEILDEVLPRAVTEIPWPRNMYWTGAEGLHFIRPIRWIVAMLGGKPLRFSLGDAVAGNSSSGHRFLGKSKIPVRSGADYIQKLKDNFVLVRPEDRKKKIEGELRRSGNRKRVADSRGCTPHESRDLSERIPDGDSWGIRPCLPRASGRNPDHRDAGSSKIFRAAAKEWGACAKFPGGHQSG